ncbi:MAG TPA: disulfide bond formation protein B [Rhizomicrobium sp.]|jgi:disulfide bond formation protein DsbB|nr:disulfide bond formation protein B [Rhizomicrobium sp.]
MMRPQSIAIGLGTAAVLLLLGALGFQYLDRLPPCELCMWQRWPHVAAAVVGLGGPLLIRVRLVERGAVWSIAALAALLVAISGAVGVYHAGIEWHWWPGPQSCTGAAFQYAGGRLDLNAPVVMCDRAAWRLFGISLAGYNALISFALAFAAAIMLARSGRKT